MHLKIVYRFVVLIHFLVLTRAQHDCAAGSKLGDNRAAGNRGEDNIPNGNTDSTVIILDTGDGSTANPPEGEVSHTASCCGKITQWRVDPQKVLGPVESMKLQIWRPEGSDSYYLVGEELFTNTNGFPATVVATSDILVQVGDKLGFTGHELEYKTSIGYNKDLAGRVLRRDGLNPAVGGTYTLATEHPDADNHITPEMIGFAFDATLTERENPECSISIAAASFAEDSPAGTLLGIITTTAFPDVTISKFTFSLTDNGGWNISVDPDSGEIRTNGTLTALPPNSIVTITGRSTEAICLKYGECLGNITVDWVNKPIQISSAPVTKSLTDSVNSITSIHTIITQDPDRQFNIDMNPSCSVLSTLPPGGPFSMAGTAVSTEFNLNFDNSSPLDAASTPTYLVTINCADKYGSSDTEIVTLNVIKNSAPFVTNTTDANGKICEEADAKVTKLSDVVLTLDIQDAESNTIFSEFINKNSSSPFGWNSSTFEVFAIADLLTLQTHYHEFSLQIWDTWNSRITYTLCVTIVGINSMPHISLCPANISIPETADVGNTICTVTAIDSNKIKDNQTHEFTIEKVDPSSFTSKFAVDSVSGNITLSGGKIDYETTYLTIKDNCIILELSVADGVHRSPNNCFICVHVLDINEPPVFNQHYYSYNMLEEETVPYPLSSLSFSFKDPDFSDTHVYKIIGGDPESYFNVSQTGVLQLVKPCDLENNCPSSFTLVLEIDDRTLQDQTTVSITVNDVNDHAPIFTRPYYSLTLSDETLLTDVLITVTATDGDSGLNKDLTYWVAGVGFGSQYYIVDASGRLKLKKKLDHTNGTKYIITICARDHGVDFQFGCTNVEVTFLKNTSQIESVKTQPCFFCSAEGVSIFSALMVGILVLAVACIYLSMKSCVLPYISKIRWSSKRRRRILNNSYSRRPPW